MIALVIFSVFALGLGLGVAIGYYEGRADGELVVRYPPHPHAAPRPTVTQPRHCWVVEPVPPGDDLFDFEQELRP